MTAANIDKIRLVPIFSTLDDSALARVAALATEFEAPHGHVLIERGQPGHGVFVIEEGAAKVELPDGTELTRGPGSFVGELAVLADAPRAARVIVTEPVRGLAIRRDDLLALIDEQPAIAVAMLHEVARRLVDST